MLAALIVIDTDAPASRDSSKTIVPSKSVKRPRTLVIRWRTWNATSECALSMMNVLTVVAEAVVVMCPP